MVLIMFFMAGTLHFGLALFLPSIVSQLGFSPNKTQLLSVGPFVAGFFGERSKCDISLKAYFLLPFVALVTIIPAFWSDHYESRGITTALISLLAVVGFALYLGNIFCF